MKNTFLQLKLLCLILPASVSTGVAQNTTLPLIPTKTPPHILREIMKASSNLSAVEYEVQVNEERQIFSALELTS